MDWLWSVLILIVVILLLVWLGRREERGQAEPVIKPVQAEPEKDSGLPEVSEVVSTVEPPAQVAPELPAAPQMEPPPAFTPDQSASLPPAGPAQQEQFEWPRENMIPLKPVEPQQPAAESAMPDLPAVEGPSAAEVTPPEPPAAEIPAPAPPEPDNLEIIEGIGPKIAALLRQQGIHTFQQLADTPPEELRQLLLAANLRIADPATWPEQARLASQGRWADLDRFQYSLKGGRRVT